MAQTREWSAIKRDHSSDPIQRERSEQERRAIHVALALGQLRQQCGVTQQELAKSLDIAQPNVSRLEHQEDLYLSTLRDYVAALGGRLEINVVFPDRTVTLTPAE